MTAMEMKRWAEACEKERRTWLRPAATAQDTTAADTARTRGYGDGTFVTHGHMSKLLRKWDTHITEKEGAGIVRRRLPVEH